MAELPFREVLGRLQPPQWVQEMFPLHDLSRRLHFYEEHGVYRTRDIRRVLGDQSKGVSTTSGKQVFGSGRKE